MIKNLIRKIIHWLKGRSANQIKKSELDNFIDSFEEKRTSEPESRKLEREKAEVIASKREFEAQD